MSLAQLTRCVSRLSLAATGSAGFPGNTNIIRCLHSSPCLLYKRDARAHPPSKFPSSNTQRWEPRQKMRDLYEYTVKPLPFPRGGERGPNGRIWNYRRSGGWKFKYHMVDWHRERVMKPGQEELQERVLSLHSVPMRSAKLAMVGNDEQKRYIVATESMEVGDIIKTSSKHGELAQKVREGDAYPLGSLPMGTTVNCVERLEGQGGRIACAAGTVATIVRKVGDQVVVRMPSKREISVSSKCMATVGRVSNIDHNKERFYKAGQRRWLGFKPKSGLWHRKTGRFGRTIRGVKPMQVFSKETQPMESFRLVLDADQQYDRFRDFHQSVRGAMNR